ncbi:30S ribosomal protein S9 [Patescibacteria group bacterium]|nr:30S ribosomal protein S9 [Patescibacteria group bacterium]MBU1931309.1 30S ribosomal protein S9 [Patescibacteria group bacterium]
MVKTVKKTKKANYTVAVGRRKCAIARVRLFRKKGNLVVNDQPVDQYFPGAVNQVFYEQPFKLAGVLGKYSATIKVVGGGPQSQLEAVIHGLARALNALDRDKYRPVLKKNGLLTRDPRVRERRKAGTGGKARRQKQSPRR